MNIESEKIQRTFGDQGFYSPIRVMSEDITNEYRRRFEAYERQHGGWYPLSQGQKLYLLQTWVAELASRTEVLDAVEAVLGPNIMCWGTSLFVKEAKDPAFVTWHQDSTYWGLSKPDVVTAWIALSPSNRSSGCMKMLPGSHHLDQVPHTDTLAAENLLTRGQVIDMQVDDSLTSYLILNPGEISLHNIRTVHASEPNTSDERRIGVAIRYIAPHVHQLQPGKDSAWLLRGEDQHGHFIHETPPQADMAPQALVEHARIMKLRQEILYTNVAGKPAHRDD